MNLHPRRQFHGMADAMQTLQQQDTRRRPPSVTEVRDWALSHQVKAAAHGQTLTALSVRPAYRTHHETVYVDAQAYRAFVERRE